MGDRDEYLSSEHLCVLAFLKQDFYVGRLDGLSIGFMSILALIPQNK